MRNPLCDDAVSQPAQGGKAGPGFLRVIEPRRHGHESLNGQILQSGNLSDQRDGLLQGNTPFCLFPADIDFNEHPGDTAGQPGSFVELNGKGHAIQGMDHVEQPDGIFGFIGLEMADHMPLDRLSHLFDLSFAFLDIVFTQDIHTRTHRFPDPVIIHRLGDGHQPDISGPAARCQSRLRNVSPDNFNLISDAQFHRFTK